MMATVYSTLIQTTKVWTTRLLIAVIVTQWVLLARIGSNSNLSSTTRDSSSFAVHCPGERSPYGQVWSGAAIGLFFQREDWTAVPYDVYISNILTRIPHDWVVQILVNDIEWFESLVLEYHRGVKRMIREHPRVELKSLPPRLHYVEAAAVWNDPWVWQQAAADRVLTFQGHGVLCSNAQHYVHDFDHLDYVAIPWNKLDGRGGSATSFSIQNRRAILQAMEYNWQQNNLNMATEQAMVATLLEMNRQIGTNFSVASPEETNWFGGITQYKTVNNSQAIDDDSDHCPLAVLINVQQVDPQAFKCAELKFLLPAIGPECLGRNVNKTLCAESLHLDLPTCMGEQ